MRKSRTRDLLALCLVVALGLGCGGTVGSNDPVGTYEANFDASDTLTLEKGGYYAHGFIVRGKTFKQRDRWELSPVDLHQREFVVTLENYKEPPPLYAVRPIGRTGFFSPIVRRSFSRIQIVIDDDRGWFYAKVK